jgi:hypothetical protein
MVLHHDAGMVGPVPDGRLEDDTLIVAFALPLGLDAVSARRPLFSTLDASLSTGQAARLRSLPHLGVGRWVPADW